MNLNKVAAGIRRFLTMKEGDELHLALASRVKEERLNEFMSLRSKKLATELEPMDERKMERLFELGGVITGGTAVATCLGEPISSQSDLDFFFKGEVDWATAVLESMSWDCCVCLYIDKPWDTFDLTLSQCALLKDGTTTMSEACQLAHNTRVADIVPQNIINATLTAKRMEKYHFRHGFKYPSAHLIGFFSLYPKALLEVSHTKGWAA